MARHTRIPTATYRLQFSKDFTFADAIRTLDYLQTLGISDVYASPLLRSRHGSEHGYDGTDPTRIDPDLGTAEDFALFQSELRTRGMGLLLDIVPNHMAASGENLWWMDVLEFGVESAYAPYFDIDWRPLSRHLKNKILLPFLGRPYGEALDCGEICLRFCDGKFFVQYFESSFPVAPRSYRQVLEDRAAEALLKSSPGIQQEYLGILSALAGYSDSEMSRPVAIADRRLRFEAIVERLRALIKSSDGMRAFIDARVAYFNGRAGEPLTFLPLEHLLSEQNYRLAYWQTLTESINYRRFFTISDLVGIRVEDPVVFEATHGGIFRWIQSDVFTGLRIDHIDGLRDPQAYLNKLQQHVVNDQAGGDKSEKEYVLVEKILSQGEELSSEWPVAGTTGYDFLDRVNRLFVCAPNAAAIERVYADFTGRTMPFEDVLHQQKKNVMSTLLAVEMRSLGRELGEIAASDRYARELPQASLREALIEVTACFPAYRTYIRSLDVPPEAREMIARAVGDARHRRPNLDPACFTFVAEVLQLCERPHLHPQQLEARLGFVMRWQQFTGPIVAKGQEDTALYVYYPLLSLNEVGSSPQPSKTGSIQEFSRFIEERQKQWPHTMNATTTHDTKRSEDARAWINVLSEIPEEWRERIETWAAWNAPYKKTLNSRQVPDANEEYFIYQTLMGMWPCDEVNSDSVLERLQQYLVKATREAMVHTRWTQPNHAHEDALKAFVASILLLPEASRFRDSFLAFHKHVAFFGMLNGVSQTLLKMTCPGVPDFYQGSELWDLRLVDPDNRQPVDFGLRRMLLDSLPRQELGKLGKASSFPPAEWGDSRIKLNLIRRTLWHRKEHAELFAEGEFLPLSAAGQDADKIISFARRHGDCWCLVVAPRWHAYGRDTDAGGFERNWHDSWISIPGGAPERWTNLLTGTAVRTISQGEGQRTIKVQEALADFPVALLAPEDPS